LVNPSFSRNSSGERDRREFPKKVGWTNKWEKGGAKGKGAMMTPIRGGNNMTPVKRQQWQPKQYGKPFQETPKNRSGETH